MELIEFILITLWQGCVAAIEHGNMSLNNKTISNAETMELYIKMGKALGILLAFYLFTVCLERLANSYANRVYQRAGR
ncbi:hypothetical protein A6E01_19300 (plasmid) [Vibrio breoganii]|uniref:Uncharacterized protein n=1 Tax=Vibrio breoganii TaxID=553239 RepID=A0AAN1CUA9_9VIBR|nr:hypothetical protein [Vibrio breoganii]ANO35362.1 hypothetical protein A6E01_19300 [Vibrio breoganii]PML12716.1 hypothetical protein BCT84_02205 [Vibrio breoganii]